MIRIRSEIIETKPPEASKRAWGRIKTKAHAEIGAKWHRDILPKHFEENARYRYHHKRRTSKYQSDKQKAAQRGKAIMGGRVDNVFTGNLKAAMQGPSTIRAFPTRATVVMRGPRYITMRPFTSNQPDKAAEITYVTKDEDKQLTALAERVVTKELNGLTSRMRTKN